MAELTLKVLEENIQKGVHDLQAKHDAALDEAKGESNDLKGMHEEFRKRNEDIDENLKEYKDRQE